MKKLFLVAVAAMMLAGCGKEGYDWGSKEEQGYGKDYGQAVLSVKEGAVVQVKSTAIVDDEVDESAYTIYASSTATPAVPVEAWNGKTLGAIQTANQTTLTLTQGVYNLSAESCSEAAAEDGNGSPRFYGTGTFTVTAGAQTPAQATVTCTLANAKVTVGYDPSMQTYFEDCNVEVTGSKTAVSGTRTVTFDKAATHADNTKDAFFNIPSVGKQTITIVVRAKKKGAGEFTVYEGTGISGNSSLELSAKSWYKITVGSTVTDQGKAALTLNVNGEVTLLEEQITVNPYN